MPCQAVLTHAAHGGCVQQQHGAARWCCAPAEREKPSDVWATEIWRAGHAGCPVCLAPACPRQASCGSVFSSLEGHGGFRAACI